MAKLLVCGAINWDNLFFVGHLPSPGEEVRVRRIERVSGGTGGNVAVAAARILGRGEVILAGALGADEIAKKQLALLEEEGVNTHLVKIIPGEESGQAYILIEESGQNIIASYLGANAALKPEHLGELAEHLSSCQGIVLTDPPLEVARILLEQAYRLNIPSFWDPGILLELVLAELTSLLPLAEVIFLNESEAQILLGSSSPDIVFQRSKDLSLRQIVLKLGGRGAVLMDRRSDLMVQIPALPLEKLGLAVVSTVGCGDAFAGAFAAYRALGKSAQEALFFATVAAGLNATRPETRGSPQRQVLEKIAQQARALGFGINLLSSK